MVSTATRLRVQYYYPGGMKVLASYSSFSTHRIIGAYFITVSREQMSRVPTGSLLSWVQVGPQFFFCGSWLEQRILSISFLARLPLSWKSSDFFCCFYCHCFSSLVCFLYCFWVASFFGSKSGLCEVKRNFRELTTVSFLRVQVSQEVCLLLTFQSPLSWFYV